MSKLNDYYVIRKKTLKEDVGIVHFNWSSYSEGDIFEINKQEEGIYNSGIYEKVLTFNAKSLYSYTFRNEFLVSDGYCETFFKINKVSTSKIEIKIEKTSLVNQYKKAELYEKMEDKETIGILQEYREVEFHDSLRSSYEDYKDYMFITNCKYRNVDFETHSIDEFSKEKPFYGYYISTFYSYPNQLILMKDYFYGEYLYFFQDGFLAEKLENISQSKVQPKILRIYSNGEIDKCNSPRLIDVVVEVRD